MKKKLVSCILIGAMLSALLTGCGASGKTTADETTDETKTETELNQDKTEGAASTEGATINITCWNEPNSNPDLDFFKQCEIATGLDINVTVIPESEYSSKLNQMVSTKDDSADIYIVWENDIKSFVEAGGIIPMDDYLENSTIETVNFIDAVSKLTKGLGATYGLPWGAATEILYYNQDMFDEAGIAYPTNDWSYADFKVAAEKLTKTSNGNTDVYGCVLPNTQTWWAGIGSVGDPIYDPQTGKLIIGEGAVTFVQDCKDMVDKGIMSEPSADTTDLFAAGKAAMQWAGSWNIGSYGTNSLAFNWDIATLPTNTIKYNTLHTGFYTINENSKNKDAAWKAIEYLMGEEGQVIASKGSGNPSAIKTIAEKGDWKVESATSVENWDAILDSLNSGVFGYTCIPAGVTNNAISLFNSAVLGEITPKEAVDQAMQYAAETIGYTLDK